MRTLYGTISLDNSMTEIDFEFEVEDDATNEEIDEICWEEGIAYVETWWEEG